MTTLLNEFELVLHGIQALRRRVERLSCPLQGGSGVRAQFYPHQVHTVREILSSLRIRHLIADEVGMGKTIQALMIMSALRLQRQGELRTLIVVPHPEAARQWSQEVLARAHTAHSDDEAVENWSDEVMPIERDSDWVRIRHRAEVLQSLSELDPDECDLLIVDEPQTLPGPILERISRQADHYAHLLLLTASPNLRSARAACRLLQILEPQRVERARRSAGENEGEVDGDDWIHRPIDDLNDSEVQKVFEALREWQRASPVMPAEGQSEAEWRFDVERTSLYRHIFRARRRDFPEHLPQRRQTFLRVEPTAEESERFRRISRYLQGYLTRKSGGKRIEQAAQIARRAALGGASLRERLGELSSDPEEDPGDELPAIREVSLPSCGDSRLDELVDWLSDFWRNDPHRKVVIAAQDNPTIDELARLLRIRIPEAGPRGARVPVEVVCARDQRADPAATMAETHIHSMLGPFQEGSAQLLLAHDVFHASYNLQAADAIVFYSLPWDPVFIDQWIGRVDRLGREVVDPERAHSKPLPVRIVTLVRDGQADARVVEEVKRWGIFDHPLTTDTAESQRIAEAIRGAGLGSATAENGVASIDGGSDSEDAVHRELRRSPAEAVALRNELAFRVPLEPRLRQARPLGYVSSGMEESLSRWLRLLADQKYFHFWKHRDDEHPENRARGYTSIIQDKKRAPVRLTFFPTRPSEIPFFVARANIQRPPRAYVRVKFKSDRGVEYFSRSLQFLDHGSSLHEDLLDTFIHVGRKVRPLAIRLCALGIRHFPHDSPLSTGRYYTAVGMIDSAFVLETDDPLRALRAGLPETEREMRKATRERAFAALRNGFEADARFVRASLPPRLCVRMSHRGVGAQRYQAVAEDRVKWDLLTPHWTDGKPHCESLEWDEAEQARIREGMIGRLAEEAAISWRELLPGFREAIADRQRLLRIEADDALRNLDARLERVRSRMAERLADPTEENRLRVARNDRPNEELLEERKVLVERHCTLRCAALDRVVDFAKAPSVESVRLQALLSIDLQPDPVPYVPETSESEDKEEEAPVDAVAASGEVAAAPQSP